MNRETDPADIILEERSVAGDVFYQIRLWDDVSGKYILSEPIENKHYARWRIYKDYGVDPDTVPVVVVEGDRRESKRIA